MSQTKHTPGPWSACNPPFTGHFTSEIQTLDSRVIADCKASAFSKEVDAANAALMAAAPDLAKSLSGAIEVIESCLKSAHDKTAEPLNQLTNDYVDCLPSWRAALGKAKAKA